VYGRYTQVGIDAADRVSAFSAGFDLFAFVGNPGWKYVDHRSDGGTLDGLLGLRVAHRSAHGDAAAQPDDNAPGFL
jgi:hypothetical protein